MVVLLWPFICLAGLGFIGIAILHFSILLGLPSPFGMQIDGLLDQGISWLVIPFLVAVLKTSWGFLGEMVQWERKSSWGPPLEWLLKLFLRGSPRWMYYLSCCLFFYVILWIIMELLLNSCPAEQETSIFMAIYWLYLSTMYSALHVYEATEKPD